MSRWKHQNDKTTRSRVHSSCAGVRCHGDERKSGAENSPSDRSDGPTMGNNRRRSPACGKREQKDVGVIISVRLLHGPCSRARSHYCADVRAFGFGFPPSPIRSSLDNLGTEDSSKVTMSTPGLVRTPAQHRAPSNRTPHLKPATTSSLPVAGLQELATFPANNLRNFNVFII